MSEPASVEEPPRPPAGAGPRPVRVTPVVPVLGAVRLLTGLWIGAAPGSVGSLLGLDPADCRRWAWALRMVAAREVALGAGTLRAWGRGEDSTGWVAGQATADAGDVVALLAAGRSGHLSRGRARRLACVAAAAAAGELATVAALERRWRTRR